MDNPSIPLLPFRMSPTDLDMKEEDRTIEEQDVSEPVLSTKAERRVIRKLDAVILPLTALMYLAASLDRSNIGNAKLQHLLDIFGSNSDTKYSIALMSFYVTYIVFNIPGTLLCTIIPPDKSLALGALIWGAASTAQAGSNTFAGIVVCRLFIGIGESGFGAAVALYYSFWYKRDEIARRLSLYIGAGSLAGAFGGLIAYGVSFIDSHLQSWRILFLIEGLPTLALAALVFFFLPSTPDRHSKYLTDNERAGLQARLERSGVSSELRFDRTAIRHALSSRTTYLNGFIYLGVNLTLGSVSGFLPTILATFGFSAARAQLMTVPPYAVAFVVTLASSYASDRLQRRGYFVMGLSLTGALGFLILLAVRDNNHVRYFATFLAVSGTFSLIPLMLSWASNTAGSHSAAAVRLGFMNACGQCFSILATFSFPAKEAPAYVRGLSLNLAFNLLAALCALYMVYFYRAENRKRDEKVARGGSSDEVDRDDARHDLRPSFRYVI